MAQLVLGTVGAIVGGIYGGPAGASIGWSIGAAIGGAVDPNVTRQQGPRMSDLSIQTSTWGVAISQIYGTMRSAGNVIWASPIRETPTTSSESAKGGPSVETTTYSYSVDLAVSLCEGEITGIRKIWAYGRLIYSVSDDADLETVVYSNQIATGFKVYIGSEDQLPDSTIEALLGVGNVPAYRGQAYVVFDNFQLGDYGNRIPNLEFEIVRSGAIEKRFDHYYRFASSKPGYTSRFYGTYADYNGIHVFEVVRDNATIYEWLLPFNGDPVVVTTFNRPGVDSALSGGQLKMGRSDEPGMFTTEAYGSIYNVIFIPSVGFEITYIGVGGMPRPDMFARRDGCIAWATSLGEIAYCPMGYVAATKIAWPDGFAIQSNTPRGIDITENHLMVCWGSPGGSSVVASYNKLTGALENAFTTAVNFGLSVSFLSDTELIYIDSVVSPRYIKIFDLVTKTVTSTGFLGSASPGFEPQSGNYDWRVFREGEVIVISYYPGGSTQQTGFWRPILNSNLSNISTIVLDQCAKAGLSAVDVSEISIPINGYAIKRQGSARSNIETLNKFGYFDAVESDHTIKFPLRGRSPVETIPFSELGAHEFGSQVPDALPMDRAQELDLPFRVSVNYVNSEKDYQGGSEHAQRIITESSQEVTVEMAIAMGPDKAAQIAEVMLFDAHTARTQFSFQNTRKYSYLDPTDVVRVEGENAVYVLRMSSTDSAGGIEKRTAVIEDVAVYSSSAVGGSDNPTQSQIGSPGPTRADYLDIPLVRDSDNNSGFYAPLTALRPAWRGATLFKSFDDLSFVGIGSVFNSATTGFALTTLGGWSGGNMFDETNLVDVNLYQGELVSATEDQVLNGENACLIGDELLQFKNAILIAPNRYRLSGLLRGRRGTDQRIPMHAANERFILMTVAGMLRPDGGTGEIGAERFYKPVSIGTRVTDVQSQSFTNTAVGLMPYAPVHLSGGKQLNGDFLIGWTRQSRIDASWRDSVDVSIGESVEAYEIDIMSGATIKRTMASSTPSVTYTSAMQTADFGGIQSTLTVNVYQMSSVVGRGFPANRTY